MQYANGSHSPNGNLSHRPDAPDEASSLGLEKSPPPAHRITDGRVITCIWANRTPWGDIAWKVEQFREKSVGHELRRYHNCYFEDLQDATRGLYKAKQWIKRAERRRRRFWWW